MNFQETIETISKRKMTEQEAFEFCRDQWGMVCSWLKGKHKYDYNHYQFIYYNYMTQKVRDILSLTQEEKSQLEKAIEDINT